MDVYVYTHTDAQMLTYTHMLAQNCRMEEDHGTVKTGYMSEEYTDEVMQMFISILMCVYIYCVYM
jgi:hypothetical protein